MSAEVAHTPTLPGPDGRVVASPSATRPSLVVLDGLVDDEHDDAFRGDAMLISLLPFPPRHSTCILSTNRLFPTFCWHTQIRLPTSTRPRVSSSQNQNPRRHKSSRAAMSRDITVHFIGTTSGGGPDRKSTRLNSSHSGESRMPSSA